MKLAIGLLCAGLVFVGMARAAESRPTNVLLFVADDASPHFGVYGCKWVKTPHIDRLAARGLVFDNAYTPTAKCSPSRAAILTGRNPWQLENAANQGPRFPPKYKAFTEAAGEAGVFVGAQGKFFAPGSAHTTDGAERMFGAVKYERGTRGKDLGKPFREFLAARPKGKPFFFWFGSDEPHRPYTLDEGVAAGMKLSDIDRVPAIWPDKDAVRRDMLDYGYRIEFFDGQVGALMKELEAIGEVDNTLVIITSDNGMPFPRLKGHNYDGANHIPLVIHWPSGVQNPGRRVADLVSLVELAPTCLDAFGIEIAKSGLSPLAAGSLTDLLQGRPGRDRRFVILGRERNEGNSRPGKPMGVGYPVRGIREGNLLYLHNFAPDRWPCGNPEMGLRDTDAGPTKEAVESTGEKSSYWQLCFGMRPAEELFDVLADPECVKNLVGEPVYREKTASLRERLFAELQRQNDPRVLGQGDVFETYPAMIRKPERKAPPAKAPTNATNQAKP